MATDRVADDNGPRSSLRRATAIGRDGLRVGGSAAWTGTGPEAAVDRRWAGGFATVHLGALEVHGEAVWQGAEGGGVDESVWGTHAVALWWFRRVGVLDALVPLVRYDHLDHEGVTQTMTGGLGAQVNPALRVLAEATVDMTGGLDETSVGATYAF